MKTILKARWLIAALWITIVAVLLATAPGMPDLIREKGTLTVPDGYSSALATDMQKRHETASEDEISLALVLHNEKSLTSEDREQIKAALSRLKEDSANLGITSILSPLDNEQLEAQMLSKDGTTMLTALSIRMEGRTTEEVRSKLDEALSQLKVEHYLTGNKLIEEDVILSSEKGLRRTEIITVVFILSVLILVFRSIVAPIIPLLTVGISYVASQSIVAFLIDRFNFPVSNFTQTFLVAILFGIGTDYCILLLSRFKEEMAANPGDLRQAIIRTYATAGKTVIYSGIAALAGFATIGFATFKLYQSAAAVAVGVAVMLVALMTIVPFFMAVLGPKLFWPTKGSLEHKESRMWAATGSFSLRKPWLALLLTAILIVPLITIYKGNLSYNSLNEIGDSYESVKGFNLISDGFGPGEAMTTKVLIESDKPMDHAEAYAAMEKISRELAKAPGVAKVRSLTRPVGDEIEAFSVASQAKTLGDGLGQGADGLETIRSGLAEASKSIGGSAPELAKATSGIEELITGTKRLQGGVSELHTGLSRLESGVRSGATGASGLQNGLAELQKSAEQLRTGSQELLTGYQSMEGGLKTLTSYYGAIERGLKQSAQALGNLEERFTSLAAKYPGLSGEEDFQTIQGTVRETSKSLNELEGALNQMTAQLTKVQEGLAQSNQGFSQIVSGQDGMIGGMAQLTQGAASLAGGLQQAADGQKQAISNLPAMENGLGQLAEGQEQLLNGFSSLGGQLQQLTDGLDQSADGLGQVKDGLVSARTYLDSLSASPDKETSGWFLPEQAATDPQFQQVINNYLSADKKLASFDLVLESNPYDEKALDSIDGIREAAEKAIQGTALSEAKIGVGGVSSVFHDLQTISNADYKRTVMLMIAGITLILIVLLRSLVMPIYLMGSLVLTYFASMAINEVVFVHIMGYSGTNWAIPFFGFVMLMALGVDYSIFLMDRFNEHKDEPVQSAILTAMKNMGTVIVSAAIILAGTFAAMYPSGVLSLLQIATVVLSGLLIYALVFLQFFVPVMVRLFGRANWWPFIPKNHDGKHSSNSLNG